MGKTAPMIHFLNWAFLNEKIHHVLIVCPNSILDNWAKEIKTWSEFGCIILRGDRYKRTELLEKPAPIYLINYEAVRIFLPLLQKKEFDTIILDEIHHAKSSTAAVTKAILKLAATAKARKGMTGTLVTNSLLDLWSIAQFIEPAIFKTNFWGFRNRYMLNANAGKPWMNFPDWRPKPGAMEEVKKMLEPWTIRFEKKDVLSYLPPMLFQRRSVELSGDQERAYNELKRHFLTELQEGKILAVPDVLPRLTKLLQVASGFVYDESSAQGAHHFKSNPKIQELQNVLEEIGNERVVIWTAFREEMEMLSEALNSNRFDFYENAVIGGQTHPDVRQSLVDNFNAGKIHHLICHPACAGEGLTILAPYVIYFSRTWKLTDRLQPLGRHHRPGAEVFDNITVIDLVTKGTVEEQVMAALTEKKDLVDRITPAAFREMIE